MATNRVLVIEDNPQTASLLTMWLSSRYSVECKANGIDGLNAAVKQPPDAVVLDLQIPGMDGTQVLAGMRKNSRTKNTPVIIFSSSAGDSELRERLQKLNGGGPLRYVQKGSRIADFLHVVRSAIGD